MQRKATAIWKGALRNGKGLVTTDSGVIRTTAYSFSTRFEQGIGTNPEELLAAAHASCFSMALSAELGKANIAPAMIETTATLTLEKIGEQWTISKVHLDTVANVPGGGQSAFEQAAEAAKTGCPVSRLFRAEITLSAKLKG